MGPVLGPQARTDRTRDTRIADPQAARPRGQAAGGGTAPDTRRPSQRWQADPPADGPPPPPRQAAPTGQAGEGERDGPPHPQARARSTWVADPNSPPSGRATGGGTAPDTRRFSQRWQATPPGTAPTTPAERGPHRARKPRGQRRAPTPAHPRPQQEWMTDPNSPPRGWTVGGGGAPDRRRPSQRTRGPRNPGCPPLRNTGNTGHRDSAGPRTRTPVPTARGQRAPTAPRRRAAGGGRAHGLARPSQQGPPRTAGGGALSAQTHTRMLAHRTGVRAPPSTPRRAHSTCTSHGKITSHPLLLGTATQQWRNARPHAKHAPYPRRWTQYTRSSGRWDSEAAKETPHKRMRARTPTWRKYRSPPRTARPRNLRRRRAACPPSARVETRPLHRRRPVPKTAPPARPR